MVHRLQKLATPIQSMAFGRDGLSVHPSLVGSLRYRSELSTKYGSSWECGSKDPLNDLVLETGGLCFGFAVDETPELIPLPISLSLVRRWRNCAIRKRIAYLRPNAKSPE